MKQPITMPALSDTMNVGRFSKWLKKPGDPVKKGEAIAEVETDKAIMEVEAFHDGYLAGPLAAVDREFPVGATIGYIADSAAEAGAQAAAASAPAEAQPRQPAKAPAAEQAPKPAATAPVPPAAPVAPNAVSPILAAAEANRPSSSGLHAHAHAVSVQSEDQLVAPIGGHANVQAGSGRVEPPAFLAEGPAYRIARASSLREAVARNMIASAATPTFRVTALLPLGGLVATAKERELSLTLLLARACGRSIAAHPLLNAAYTDSGLAQRDRIDIGIAVDSPEGLITPVLRDVSGRSLGELGADWQAVREKVRSRRLVPSDYRGATFYLSDLGVFPVVYAFDSIVPAGASAILSVAANRKKGAFCTLSCDHRVVFGGDAARFLQTLNEVLSDPAKLCEEEKIQ